MEGIIIRSKVSEVSKRYDLIFIITYFTGKLLTIDFASNWALLVGLLLFAILVGIIAGIYPAFVISGFKPALILKGQQGSAKGKSTLRKVLVVTQFSISIVLIIATMITFQQLQFLNNRELGYNKDLVVSSQRSP